MPLKRVRPPRSIQGSAERDHAAWERQVQDKVGDSSFSIGEIETIVGLLSSQKTNIEELKRRIDELENSIWLLRQN